MRPNTESWTNSVLTNDQIRIHDNLPTRVSTRHTGDPEFLLGQYGAMPDWEKDERTPVGLGFSFMKKT